MVYTQRALAWLMFVFRMSLCSIYLKKYPGDAKCNKRVGYSIIHIQQRWLFSQLPVACHGMQKMDRIKMSRPCGS
jgi:hypothetical protein